MSQYITLRHATPRRNLPAIMARGLDPACSLGAIQAVWLHSPCRTAWAILHTAQRHQCSVNDIAIISVRVPRKWLTRRRRCVWTCGVNIRATGFVSVNPRAAITEAA
jgi:hypothetical protein